MKEDMDNIKIDRNSVVVVSNNKKDSSDLKNDDLKFWLTQSPNARISAVEFYRRQYYGTIQGLQRSINITKQK